MAASFSCILEQSPQKKEKPPKPKKMVIPRASQWPSLYFHYGAAEERYHHDFKHKKLIPSRGVYFDEISALDIEGLIADAGLLGLFELESNYYPSAVKLFYTNMSHKSDLTILKTYVFGKPIEFNFEIINSVLGRVELNTME